MSLIEVIEHMRPDTLSKAMETVFGQLKPKIVVITTPNNEFNVVFDDLNHVKSELSREHKFKFRHDDHHFEFNRKEFEDWCQSLLKKYPEYKIIEHSGLGTNLPFIFNLKFN